MIVINTTRREIGVVLAWNVRHQDNAIAVTYLTCTGAIKERLFGTHVKTAQLENVFYEMHKRTLKNG